MVHADQVKDKIITTEAITRFNTLATYCMHVCTV